MSKFINFENLKNIFYDCFNNSNIEKNTIINISCLNLKFEDDDLFGVQKYINNEKYKQIEQLLKSNRFNKVEYECKEYIYEDKIKLQYNNLTEYHKVHTINNYMSNNIIISEFYNESIEPTQFPNVIKYSKYKKIEFKFNNITIIFKSYSFDNYKNYYCEIEINKYYNLNSHFYNIDNILYLIKNIYLI